MRRARQQSLAELPPGRLASVWRDEGYIEAAYWCEERIGIMTDGGVPVDVAEREAPLLTRQWWRSLSEAERRAGWSPPRRPGG